MLEFARMDEVEATGRKLQKLSGRGESKEKLDRYNTLSE